MLVLDPSQCVARHPALIPPAEHGREDCPPPSDPALKPSRRPAPSEMPGRCRRPGNGPRNWSGCRKHTTSRCNASGPTRMPLGRRSLLRHPSLAQPARHVASYKARMDAAGAIPAKFAQAFRHAMLDQRSSPVSFPRATRPRRALLYCAAACMGGRERKCGITSSPTIRYCSTIFSLGVVSGGDRLICCIPG
jgi:hypothetical protein